MKHFFKQWMLALAMLLSARSAAAGDPNDNGGFFDHPRDSAQKLFLKARELQKKGQHADAEPLLAKALVHHGRADIAAALGESEVVLKHYAEAMKHLRYAYNLLPDDGSPILVGVKKNLARARKHVATLTFRVVPSTAQVSIDQQSPLKSHSKEIYVLSGEHTVRAELKGYEPVQVKKRFPPGDTTRVELVLTPLRDKLPSEGLSSYAVGAIITGTTTAVLAGVGIGLFFAGQNQADDARSLKQACLSAGQCAGVQEVHDDADTLYNASGGVLVAGGLTFTTTVVLAVMALVNESDQAILLPIVSPQFAGFQFTTSF